MLPSTNRPLALLLRSDERPVLRFLTAAWAFLTGVHMMIATIGGHLDRPWWLWATLPLGLALWAAWWLSVPERLGDDLVS